MSNSLHIVCNHCDAVNRVPEQRLAEQPRCGSCKALLFDGHPASLSEASMRKQLRKSDLPLLVDFWAAWCGPCKMMAPAYEQATDALEPRFRVVKVNTEEAPVLSSEFGIRSIPTLIVFHGGREIARQPGAMSQNDIVRWAIAQLGES